jgi:hypothetical protein
MPTVNKTSIGMSAQLPVPQRGFTACDGKLVGRPDVISGDEIID